MGDGPGEDGEMIYHPFVTRVSSNMAMRRERMLPVRGEVLVGTGSPLEPSDIVASTTLSSEMQLLSVAKGLGVSEEDFSRCLRVGVGDLVKEGDVLAAREGATRLFGRTYRSPISGVVTAISNGRLLIQSARSTLELKAHYRGTVLSVMSGLGVIVEVKGALIQGIWGTDEEGFGVLKLAVTGPGESMDPEAVDMSCRGTILVGACSVGEETLYRAREMEVEGILVGSLDAGLRELVHSMPFPLVVTEGFGKFPISLPIFDLLRSYEGQEASIRGTMEARGGAVRPEMIIYLPHVPGEPVVESRPELVLGRRAQVRIVRGPRLGQTGQVVDFPLHGRRLESGATCRGVEVKLESGEVVFVPQANVELLC